MKNYLYRLLRIASHVCYKNSEFLDCLISLLLSEILQMFSIYLSLFVVGRVWLDQPVPLDMMEMMDHR